MAFVEFEPTSFLCVPGGPGLAVPFGTYLVFPNDSLYYSSWYKFIPVSFRTQTTKILRVTVAAPVTNGIVILPYYIVVYDDEGNQVLFSGNLNIEIQNTTNYFYADLDVSSMIDATTVFAGFTLVRNAPGYVGTDTLAGDMYFVSARIV
jgi:hypothetical protein